MLTGPGFEPESFYNNITFSTHFVDKIECYFITLFFIREKIAPNHYFTAAT